MVKITSKYDALSARREVASTRKDVAAAKANRRAREAREVPADVSALLTFPLRWAIETRRALIPVVMVPDPDSGEMKKKPPRGFSLKTHRAHWTRPHQALSWQKQYPGCLWAICTGDQYDLVALDIDTEEGQAAIERLGLPVACTTGTGKPRVFIVGAPKRIRTKSAPTTGPFAGIEVKANYRNGTPSKVTFHGVRPDTGGEYVFHGPDLILRWADAPETLREYLLADLVEPVAAEERSGGHMGSSDPSMGAQMLTRALQKVADGEGRSDTGHWLASQLRDESQGDWEFVERWMEMFRSEVTGASDQQYTETEVADTIASVKREEMREPASFLKGNGPDPVTIRSLGTVEGKRLHWLWPDRVAYGKLTNFEGDPEHGKSLVTMDLGSTITRGGKFPDGQRAEPGALLLICAEDDVEDTIVPRLIATGARMDRVFDLPVRKIDGRIVPYTLPEDTPVLRDAIEQAKRKTGLDNVVVIVDPVAAYLSEKVNSHNDASVRKATSPLAELARDTDAAFWLVRHLNKNSGESNVAYRGGGSIGFFAAVRSSFIFGKDHYSPEIVVMAQSKNNLGTSCDELPAMQYVIEGVDIDTPEGETINAPRIVWMGRSDLTFREVLGGHDKRKDAPQRAKAEDVLLELMGDGATLDVRLAQERCKELDISPSSQQRASRKLGWTSQKVHRPDGKVDHWEYVVGTGAES